MTNSILTGRRAERSILCTMTRIGEGYAADSMHEPASFGMLGLADQRTAAVGLETIGRRCHKVDQRNEREWVH